MSELTLRDLQRGVRFGQRYSKAYFADPRPHKRLAHNAMHLVKSAAKILALCEELDHHDKPITEGERDMVMKMLADLVIVGAHTAKELPGGSLDLQAVLWSRVADKDAWEGPSDERDPYDIAFEQVPRSEHIVTVEDECTRRCPGCARMDAIMKQVNEDRAARAGGAT